MKEILKTSDNKSVLLVLSAPSGAGKTTIARRLLQKNKNFSISISCTTRKPRDNEIEGKDYYFLTDEQFIEKVDKGEMLEWAEVHGNYYGTPNSEIHRLQKRGKDIIFDIDIQGGMNIKERYPKATVLVFILTSDQSELKKRLQDRGTETEKDIEKRLKNAEKEVNIAMKNYEYFVVNDRLEKSVRDIESIVSSYKKKYYFQREVLKKWKK
ncbi:MAG: guanylate kinase [Candidatus Mcinerneyibacterium aminivorans]|uniref:Guanylate kinase n=1 Tax=Candidatus Mcinerneyibacterium aminivorans TaxID=2703815 RepID=A0A5D0MII4_9BACT|nr:MAG: guanylate kinase [Candidatus Mcinerneyibacterium aminivorans]